MRPPNWGECKAFLDYIENPPSPHTDPMNCRMGCLLAVRGLTPRQLLPKFVVSMQTMQDQLPVPLQLQGGGDHLAGPAQQLL